MCLSDGLRQGVYYQPKTIQDLNPDFRINPDPDVRRIVTKMSWVYYLVRFSHFTQFRKNRQMTLSEMLINLQKSPILQW